MNKTSNIASPEGQSPASPCIRLCAVSARAGFCIGCGRKMMEIGNWSGYSDAEKMAVLEQLPARLETLKTA